jgi:hypothetical protein
MTTDNFCLYLQNRLDQTSQTGGQWYSDTSPLVFLALSMGRAGNTYLTGRLNTVDLLIKMACLVEEGKIFLSIKSTKYELITTRRSTVLILPFQQGFLAMR